MKNSGHSVITCTRCKKRRKQAFFFISMHRGDVRICQICVRAALSFVLCDQPQLTSKVAKYLQKGTGLTDDRFEAKGRADG